MSTENKGLDYLQSGNYLKDLLWIEPLTTSTLARGMEEDGDAFATAAFCQGMHKRYGVQVRVQKEVAEDLMASDMVNLEFREIPWPAKSVELYFEDSPLPTALITRTTVPELKKLFPGLELHTRPGMPDLLNDARAMLYMADRTGIAHVLNVPESTWNGLVNEGDIVRMPGGMDLTGPENEALLAMVRLALKVFAYAALPHYRPQPVSVITRAMGGKPGWKGRPNRPASRIIYLPCVHTPRAEAEAHGMEPGSSHRAHMRRGYFRIYRHEKWKNMKGKMLFIAPTYVRGETGNPPPRYVVRKPSASP